MDATPACPLPQCPRCAKLTNRIRQTELLLVVSVIAYHVSTWERVVACPACTRRAIVKRLLVSIPLSNILFVVVGPLLLLQLLWSCRPVPPGTPADFQAVAAPLRPPAEKADWMGDARGRRRRLVVIVHVLGAVALAALIAPW
jgi:hypothetical protein